MQKRLIAIETSVRPGSVALAELQPRGVRVVHLASLPADQTTAQSMATHLQNALQKVGWRSHDVQLVAVNTGPGSFTGLRIGVTFAKTFAYAVKGEVLSVSTMDILVHQARRALPKATGRIWTVVDAHRGQIFSALYELGERHEMCLRMSTRVIALGAWHDMIQSSDLVVGPVATRILRDSPTELSILPDDASLPSASTVADVAWLRWQSGERDDIWRLVPKYYRASAAEEQLRSREQRPSNEAHLEH